MCESQQSDRRKKKDASAGGIINVLLVRCHFIILIGLPRLSTPVTVKNCGFQGGDSLAGNLSPSFLLAKMKME
jgi:hypothetical protein